MGGQGASSYMTYLATLSRSNPPFFKSFALFLQAGLENGQKTAAFTAVFIVHVFISSVFLMYIRPTMILVKNESHGRISVPGMYGGICERHGAPTTLDKKPSKN